MNGAARVRVDRWLWAVRMYKTRSAATDACRSGHVKVNGTTAKPAALVTVGDRVEARAHNGERVLEVVDPIAQRVGAPLAAQCYVDHTPERPRDEPPPLFVRERSAGRPTKRERRELDRFRGR